MNASPGLALAPTIEEDGPAITPLKAGTHPQSMAVAGPWLLMRRKLLRQKLAVLSGLVIVALYLVGIFAELFAPGLPEASRAQYTFAPPQTLSLFVTDPDGSSRLQLHVKGYRTEIDRVALRRTFVVDERKVTPVGLFVKGPAYRLWGLIPMD